MKIPESTIEKGVERHFQELGFITKTQYEIQIGSNKGRADVAIYKPNPPQLFLSANLHERVAAIVECKEQRKVGYGIEQLMSYLCATGVRLGVFANSIFPQTWKYFENHGGNDLRKITYNQFHALLRAEEETQEKIEQRIQNRTRFLISEAAKERATEALIKQRAEFLINREAEKRVTETSVRVLTERILKGRLRIAVSSEEKVRKELEESKTEVAELKEKAKESKAKVAELKEKAEGRLAWCILGWSFVVIFLFALISG